MRERPIIMSASMVRAILAGTKTQTRRAVEPYGRDDGFCIMETENRGLWPYRSDDGESCFITIDGYLNEVALRCPYGVPGDRLWVRETHLYVGPGSGSDLPSYIEERKDPANHKRENVWYRADRADHESYRWTPSIHMPRWASRITLEITGVRVERLQNISEADAMAEGASPVLVPPDGGSQPHVVGYRDLWESINGPDSWDANPWVWVVAFRRVA